MNTTNNGMNKPRIALTPRLVHDQNINQSVISSYADAVIKNGGLAYLLTIDLDNIDEIVNDFDGLVVTGGADVTPSLYHEDAIANEDNYHYECDLFDIALIRAFMKADKPILGICRGLQIINVVCGGSLYQDIDTYYRNLDNIHNINNIDNKLSHMIKIDESSSLYEITRQKELMVNSYHHQAIKTLGQGLFSVAVSDDGIIEAIEGDNIIAVQWHPERMCFTHQRTDTVDGSLLLSHFLTMT